MGRARGYFFLVVLVYLRANAAFTFDVELTDYQINEIPSFGDVLNQNVEIFWVDFEVWKVAEIIQEFCNPWKKI